VIAVPTSAPSLYAQVHDGAESDDLSDTSSSGRRPTPAIALATHSLHSIAQGTKSASNTLIPFCTYHWTLRGLFRISLDHLGQPLFRTIYSGNQVQSKFCASRNPRRHRLVDAGPRPFPPQGPRVGTLIEPQSKNRFLHPQMKLHFSDAKTSPVRLAPFHHRRPAFGRGHGATTARNASCRRRWHTVRFCGPRKGERTSVANVFILQWKRS